MKKDDQVCGCCGPGAQRGLDHIIGMLERQREREKPVNQADIPTGEWPVVKAGATEATPSSKSEG